MPQAISRPVPTVTKPAFSRLQKERTSAWLRVRELVGLSEKEDRGFTNAEQCEYDQCVNRFHRLGAEIETSYPNWVYD